MDPPEEFVTLREVSFWAGLVCTILNLLVFLTFIVFEEKRRAAWSPLNFGFTLSIFFFSLAFTLGVKIPAADLVGIAPLCGLVGSLMFYFAASLVFLWTFITIHLYVRIVRNHEIAQVTPMVFFSYGASIFAAVIPNIVPGFEFNGAFCMIPFDHVLWQISIGFFLSCALIGLFFWLSILWVVLRTHQRNKQRTKSATPSSAAPPAAATPPPSSPYFYSASYPYPPSSMPKSGDAEIGGGAAHEGASNTMADKYLLVFRQFIFVTGFLLALLVLSGVHMSDLHHNAKRSASIECFTLCVISLDSVLVFGINKQNFDLWRAFFRAHCCSPRRSYAEIR